MDDDISQQISENLAELEPQVTSLDPNERKLARRLRIERRLEALKRQQNQPEEEVVEEVKDKSLTQVQIEKSIEVLKKLLTEGEERITNIRVANDARETDRREAEGINREKIIASLEEEANLAVEAFNQISEKWLSIFKCNDPLHINDEIIQQKEKCEELIKQKDCVIKMLKDEIMAAERKFTLDQRKQIDDIYLLSHRIEKQIALTRNAYREQLKLIEESMQAERKMMMEVNARKWDDLYKKRDQEEQANSDKKYEQMEEFDEQMTQLRRNFNEKYREMKINLERDIDHLEQELERIKALAILNSEKLDYNYQILKKREDENIIIKSQQKRRINKLQDIVNTLKRKISDYSEGTKQQITKVSMEIAKLQKNILDIEAKADHFAEINNLKFEQLWDMNRDRVMEVARRILTIDKILHEQVLGLEWYDKGILNKKELKKTNLPSYIQAIEILKEEDGDFKPDKSLALVKRRKSNTQLDPDKQEMRENLLRHVMEQIADRAGFILEDRLQKILEPFLDAEKTLVRMDNVFSALNVRREADIDELLEFFLPFAHCPVCDMNRTISEGEEKELAVHEASMTEEDSYSEEVLSICQYSDELGLDENQSSHATMPVTYLSEAVVTNITNEVIERDDSSDSSVSGQVSFVQYETMDPLENMPPLKIGGTNQDELSALVSTHTEMGMKEKLSCQYQHPLVISSVYVLKALRHFVSNYYKQKKALPTMAQRLNRKRNTICRLVEEEDIKMYWEQFKNVFTEENENVWNALSEGLTKYHAILKDRRNLNDEVVELRQENFELKSLLERYIEDPSDPTLEAPCAFQRETPPGIRSRKL